MSHAWIRARRTLLLIILISKISVSHQLSKIDLFGQETQEDWNEYSEKLVKNKVREMTQERTAINEIAKEIDRLGQNLDGRQATLNKKVTNKEDFSHKEILKVIETKMNLEAQTRSLSKAVDRYAKAKSDLFVVKKLGRVSSDSLRKEFEKLQFDKSVQFFSEKIFLNKLEIEKEKQEAREQTLAKILKHGLQNDVSQQEQLREEVTKVKKLVEKVLQAANKFAKTQEQFQGNTSTFEIFLERITADLKSFVRCGSCEAGAHSPEDTRVPSRQESPDIVVEIETQSEDEPAESQSPPSRPPRSPETHQPKRGPSRKPRSPSTGSSTGSQRSTSQSSKERSPTPPPKRRSSKYKSERQEHPRRSHKRRRDPSRSRSPSTHRVLKRSRPELLQLRSYVPRGFERPELFQKCAFCSSRHYSSECGEYITTEERLKRAAKLGTCVKCLKKHGEGGCAREHDCTLCKKASKMDRSYNPPRDHHQALCPLAKPRLNQDP